MTGCTLPLVKRSDTRAARPSLGIAPLSERAPLVAEEGRQAGCDATRAEGCAAAEICRSCHFLTAVGGLFNDQVRAGIPLVAEEGGQARRDAT
ncbi:hypothetical protein L3i23_29770 [Herbiconiux sp. L3-i23]|nr:hypothetical protein L3i23_29770 [Herbiconiux sp. L3-i23]